MLSQSLDLLQARDYPESSWALPGKGSWAFPGEVFIILAPSRPFPPQNWQSERHICHVEQREESILSHPWDPLSASLGRIRVLGLHPWDGADNPQGELILSPVQGRALQMRPGNVFWEMEAQ